MIKTKYIDRSNYEVLNFSLGLLTSIYKTNKNINGIYINYLYRDNLSVARMILISDKSLSQEEMSKFDIIIEELYKSIGIKIEIYNSLTDDYDNDIFIRRKYENARDLVYGDILYDRDGIYNRLKEELLNTKKNYLPPYIHTLKLKQKTK
mgnify:CR=1 FL=1